MTTQSFGHQPAHYPAVVNLCERTTWAEILSGDIVIIENLAMRVSRNGDLFQVQPATRENEYDYLLPQWSAPVRVDQALPVIRLKRAPESVAFAILEFSGLGPVVIE